MASSDYKTINVKQDTWKKLNQLKILHDKSSLDEVINEEIDFSEVE